MKTLAGIEVGKSENHLAIVNDDFTVDKVVRIRGRWMYVKKCVRDEKMESGLFMPDKTRHNTTFLLVLAKGEDTMTPANVNDIVTAPDDAPQGIMRSPYCEDDYFVREDLIQLLIPREST